MRALFIGDPHLKITRFELAKQFLAWLDKTIAEVKPDVVINLGDTFDTHAVLRSEIMTEFIKHVDRTVAICPYVYLLGNHDMYKPNSSLYHALGHLKGKIKDFHVVDEITELFDMTFVPYQPDISKFPTKTLSICVAHQTFKGADYGDITTQEGVDANGVKGCDIIISGHIHKRQRLDYGADNLQGGQVFYVGSPFAQSASDINQIKGLSLIDTATLKEKFIQCPMPSWRGDKFTIEPGFTTENMHSILEANLPGSKDHWVIEMTGTKAEINKYLQSDEYKKTVEGVDIKVKTSFTDREKRQIRIESLSIDQIITQWVTKVYSGSLDKHILTEKALDILKSTDS